MSDLPSLVWFAGALDSQGRLSVTQNRHGQPFPIIAITQNEIALPTMFARRFGGRVRLYAKENRYIWLRTGKTAQAILRELRPHMLIRCAAVDRLLLIEVRPNGRRPMRPRIKASEILGQRL